MFTALPPFGFFNQKPKNIDQYTCVMYFDNLSGIDYQNHGIWYDIILKIGFQKNVLATKFSK